MRARVARVRLQRAPNQIPTCIDIWGLLSDHVCVGSDRFWHAVEADPGDARPHAREDDIAATCRGPGRAGAGRRGNVIIRSVC